VPDSVQDSSRDFRLAVVTSAPFFRIADDTDLVYEHHGSIGARKATGKSESELILLKEKPRWRWRTG